MNKINLILKDVVKKNLQQTRETKLRESLEILKNKEGKDLIESYLDLTIKLLKEGYKTNEIHQQLNEQENIMDKLKNFDYLGEFKSTMWDTIKEMCIYWILTFIFKDMKKSTAMNISRLVTNITPLMLLRPFKDLEYCQKYGPELIDGILEVAGRYFMEKISGAEPENETWLQILSVGLGNELGSLIQKTDTGETIANKVCPLIHKN